MKITADQVKALCQANELQIPEDELQDVANRMSLWLTAMEDIEAELGDQMNTVDPIAPVFPHKDY